MLDLIVDTDKHARARRARNATAGAAGLARPASATATLVGARARVPAGARGRFLGPDEQVIPADINCVARARRARRGYPIPPAFMARARASGHQPQGVRRDVGGGRLRRARAPFGRSRRGGLHRQDDAARASTGSGSAGNAIRILARDGGARAKDRRRRRRDGLREDEPLDTAELPTAPRCAPAAAARAPSTRCRRPRPATTARRTRRRGPLPARLDAHARRRRRRRGRAAGQAQRRELAGVPGAERATARRRRCSAREGGAPPQARARLPALRARGRAHRQGASANSWRSRSPSRSRSGV